MANGNDPLSISFDNDLGPMSNAFNVDTSVPGQVTLSGISAMMEWAVGPASGHGYGTYTVEAKLTGDQPGPAIVFWPGDNNWPGQEIDLVELLPRGGGQEYATVHWNSGGDSYLGQIFNGVGTNAWHQYQMVWEPGKITINVDGKTQAVFTDHVPTDYAHGGMNDTIGFLNTNPSTSITVSQVDYVPLGGTATSTAGTVVNALASTAAAAANTLGEPLLPDGSVDWYTLAARVTANYEATGQWHL
jgi:hypothetical protein